MPYGPSQFQLTVIKPYYKDNSSKPLQDVLEDVLDNILEDILENVLKDILEDILKNIPEDILEDVLEENHDQYTLKGDYNSNIIIVDIPQPRRGRGRLKRLQNH